MITSKDFASLLNASGPVVSTNRSAPRRFASASLEGDVLSMVTSAPNDDANLTAMCPSPPSPRTATLCPGPTFQWRSGEYVVIPAHNRGPTPSKASFGETDNP